MQNRLIEASLVLLGNFLDDAGDQRFGRGVVLTTVNDKVGDSMSVGIFGVTERRPFLAEINLVGNLCFLIKHNSFIVETG